MTWGEGSAITRSTTTQSQLGTKSMSAAFLASVESDWSSHRSKPFTLAFKKCIAMFTHSWQASIRKIPTPTLIENGSERTQNAKSIWIFFSFVSNGNHLVQTFVPMNNVKTQILGWDGILANAAHQDRLQMEDPGSDLLPLGRPLWQVTAEFLPEARCDIAKTWSLSRPTELVRPYFVVKIGRESPFKKWKRISTKVGKTFQAKHFRKKGVQYWRSHAWAARDYCELPQRSRAQQQNCVRTSVATFTDPVHNVTAPMPN